MPRVMVDSNVLLDIFTEDPAWFKWSSAALGRAAEDGLLVINPIIYAEVSVRFPRVEDWDEALGAIGFERRPLPYAAAFLAAKCFPDYRRRGGPRPSVPPDFFSSAHAAIEALPLLARDVGRYRTYLLRLQRICPR